MKHLAIDWSDFIARAAVWDRLAPETRRVLSRLDASRALDRDVYGDDLGTLLDADILVPMEDGRRVRPHPDRRAWLRALRSLGRHDLLGEPDPKVLFEYLRDHFTAEERRVLAYNPVSGYTAYWTSDHSARTVQSATSVGWIEAFLEGTLPDIAEVARAASPAVDPAVTQRHAQELVRRLMDTPEPVALSALPERFPELDAASLGAAVHLAVRQLALFPALRPDDLGLVLTLWPGIVARLHRPAPEPPRPVEADPTFAAPLLIEDMTAVLIEASAEPLRLRKTDHALFARTQDRLEEALMPVPEWLRPLESAAPVYRLRLALDALLSLEFLRRRRHGNPVLVSTTAARDWLAGTPRTRLRAVLEPMRVDTSPDGALGSTPATHRRTSPDDDGFGHGPGAWIQQSGARDEIRIGSPDELRLVPPIPIRYRDDARAATVEAALARAYLSLPEDGAFVRFEDFVHYHGQRDNPLEEDTIRRALSRGWSGYGPLTDEDIEALWQNTLIEVFHARLMPLGAVRLGLHEGALCIALTSIGRYLLGEARDFELETGEAPAGQVIVQPDFEVVFTAPAPLAEAAIARLAERRGTGVGVLFRITREAVFSAAAAGLSAEEALETLRAHAALGVPDNVAREVAGWFERCRRVTLRPATLIECPDEQTAARVATAAGKNASLLAPTVVELRESGDKAALTRKLAKAGIFIDETRTKRRR